MVLIFLSISFVSTVFDYFLNVEDGDGVYVKLVVKYVFRTELIELWTEWLTLRPEGDCFLKNDSPRRSLMLQEWWDL